MTLKKELLRSLWVDPRSEVSVATQGPGRVPLKASLTQTPGRIQKVDPLIWDPNYYRVLHRNPL